MNIFFLIINIVIFCLGLIIGSFLNSVIWRLSVTKSVVKGRSMCPYCKHQLFSKDLIPLLSFLFLKGRCRYCKKPISWQYPLVELATAFIFLLFFNLYYPNVLFVVFISIISCFLTVIFVYDLKHLMIPDNVLWTGIIITLFYRLSETIFITKNYTGLLYYGLAILIASGFFLFLYLISKGKWIGFGDVKLAILLGLILGWPNILIGLFLSYLIGAIIGTGLMISKKKKAKSEIPFAPFLITGTILALIFGQNIINWHLNLIR